MLKYIVIGIAIIVAVVLLRRLFGHRPIEPFSRQPPKQLSKDGGTVTAEIAGQEIDIDPAVLDEVRRLLDRGEKIEAIKHLREATGLGLAEAKQLVDSLEGLKRR